MTSRLLVGLAGPSSATHAVPEGTTDALCGAQVTGVLEWDFPGGASSLCRICLREKARMESSVPLRAFGERKRAGGM